MEVEYNLFGINGLNYIKNFISEEEEEFLVKFIDSNLWDVSISRRTQHYGYLYSYKKKAMPEKTTPIPKEFDFLTKRLQDNFIISEIPDQIIINEYLPGQGISKHTDNIFYFKDNVLSLSLLSDIEMVFSRGSSDKNLILQNRSLLQLTEDARYKWTHEIIPRKYDNFIERSRRISITFRKMKI